MALGTSPQFQGHWCWPLVRAKLWPYRGLGEGVSGPTGGLCALLSWLLEQPWGLQVSVFMSEVGTGQDVRPGWSPAPACLLVTDVLSSLAVHFRYVVFHPFLDEILIGKIKGCSPEGVHGNPDPGSTVGVPLASPGPCVGWVSYRSRNLCVGRGRSQPPLTFTG